MDEKYLEFLIKIFKKQSNEKLKGLNRRMFFRSKKQIRREKAEERDKVCKKARGRKR